MTIKKLLRGTVAALLCAGTVLSVTPVFAADEAPTPILHYDFENDEGKTVTDKAGENHASLHGGASVKNVSERGSNALYFGGQNGYLEFPKGFFDGMTQLTLSMDIYSEMDSGNFFTVAIGKDTNKYLFLRTRSSEFRYAITKESWTAESDVIASGRLGGTWVNVTLTMSGKSMKLYIDGELTDSQSSLPANIADFGSDVIAYLGKSFYDGDAYFKGYIDNVKVYGKSLSETEVSSVLGIKLSPIKKIYAEDTTTTACSIDKENRTADIYVSKSAGADESGAKLVFSLRKNAKLKSEEDVTVKYGTPTEVIFEVEDNGTVTEEKWTVTAHLAANPVLKGQFADPDIDIFGDTYYLYTTTDGHAGWSGTNFHVFSSKNLVDWTDEGIILDVSKGKDVKWSVGSAWAPSIEEKNGKYYFYFCAKDSSGTSHIGVAVADSPTGPFVAEDEPLMTVAMCKSRGVAMGQAIDPSIFTDDDGTSYMLFGNGNAAIVQLNEDMVSCDLTTLKNYQNVTDFREAITCTKRDGVYHFTWSCDDTGSPNYHVNYGTAKSIYGPIRYRGTVLEKNAELDILGTGHHCMLQIPGEDEYYIAYHRFYTPLGHFTDGTGHHRQTCIDRVTFSDDNIMETITPTHEGVAKRYLSAEAEAADKETEDIAPDTGDSTDTVTEAPDTNADTEAPKKSGCSSSVGSVGLALAATAAAVFSKKKREEEE